MSCTLLVPLSYSRKQFKCFLKMKRCSLLATQYPWKTSTSLMLNRCKFPCAIRHLITHSLTLVISKGPIHQELYLLGVRCLLYRRLFLWNEIPDQVSGQFVSWQVQPLGCYFNILFFVFDKAWWLPDPIIHLESIMRLVIRVTQ